MWFLSYTLQTSWHNLSSNNLLLSFWRPKEMYNLQKRLKIHRQPVDKFLLAICAKEKKVSINNTVHTPGTKFSDIKNVKKHITLQAIYHFQALSWQEYKLMQQSSRNCKLFHQSKLNIRVKKANQVQYLSSQARSNSLRELE